MKTMTTKNALKLLLFLFILLSAKAFSHPKLPIVAASSNCETRMGSSVSPKSASKTSKNNAMRSTTGASKVRLKTSVSK